MDFLQQFGEYFAQMPDHWDDLVNNLPKYLPIIGMLIVIESLLSVDNAAVLATMVAKLPKEQRVKSLKIRYFWCVVFSEEFA